MCRCKNGNPKRQSRFICLKCLDENTLAQGIQRKIQREKYHIKDLYCIKCRTETKNIEIRYCDSLDDVYEEAIRIRPQYYSDNEENNVERTV